MAGSSNRRDLYLQVSANVDSLRSNLKAGKSALIEFAGDASAQIEAVQRAIQDGLGGNGAANAAKALTDNYTKAFNAIRNNARQVAGAGSGADALGILNVQGAKQVAEAAQLQAVMLRQVADAATLAATAQGNENQALVSYAAAALTAADDAERYAAATRDQVAALEVVGSQLTTTVTPLANVAKQSASSRQGVLVLGEQFRQLGTEIALGISPATAFAQQIGQIGYSLTLFEGSLGSVGTFLAGPWGIALTVGVSVLAPFVAKLFEAHDAAVAAKIGSDGLADAQGVLGKMFDLTSGKLERQNELLRLNAELTALNLRAEAAQDRQTAIDTSHKAVSPGVGDRLQGVLDRGIIEGWSGSDLGNRNRANIANIIDSVHSGSMSRETALKLSGTQDFTGVNVTREQFQQAIIASAEAPLKDKIADDIEQALRSGVLPKELRETTKARKPKVDHSAEQAANRDRAYQSQLDQAQDRVARAQLALADTAEGELAVKLDELRASKAQRDAEIDDEVAAKRITPAQAEQLKALNAQAEQLQEQKATRDEQSAILNRQLDALRLELDGQISILQMRSDLATTAAERRRLALQILDLQRKEALAFQQKIIDDPNSTADQRANARTAQDQIEQQFGLQKKLADQQNAGPLGQFKQQLKRDAGDMNEALQSVEADGLRSLEDGLVGIIDGTESAAAAFKKMAASIIDDIARIVVERAILAAIDHGSLFGFSLGGEVEGHAIGGLLHGPGTGTSDSIIARVSNGEYIINAESTRRWLPLLEAINSGQMHGFADGGLVAIPTNMPRMPSSASLRRRDDRLHVTTDVNVQPSPLFKTAIQQTTIQTVGAAAEPIMAGAETRTMKRLNRPPLPGGWG